MIIQTTTGSSGSVKGGSHIAIKLAGGVFAYVSLLCSISFWISFGFYYIPAAPKLNLTGFDWFKIMAAAVILSVVAAACRAKLWKVALPVALVMFFMVMYIMGT